MRNAECGIIGGALCAHYKDLSAPVEMTERFVEGAEPYIRAKRKYGAPEKYFVENFLGRGQINEARVKAANP